MCLTGVDYFSTLGYQPGIAFLAAGALSPLATLILILVTLFCALPIYSYVARESPHGDGSIAMLAHLLDWWKQKLFVLILLGFVATDFVITITLSAADATAHVIENPFAPHFLHGQQVLVTLGFITLLGLVFLKGFREAVGIAVWLVLAYLGLNAIVICRGLVDLFFHGREVHNWWEALTHYHGGGFLPVMGAALLVFPKLALGLSGFETGVVVMPLVKGEPNDHPKRPKGRIANTRKLLMTAAIIMSVFLMGSSLVTSILIPAEAFQPAQNGQPAGAANGRALAFLAHKFFGDGFGTLYDLSTILILWFAGASAMAGLLNIVPRYLPRYGMAPEWTRAVRPLVVVFIAIAFGVTIYFNADVNAQGGAYATGVLVLMTSAAVAVTLSAKRHLLPKLAWLFGLITVVFAFTTVVNVIERPDGIRIAAFFILAIFFSSFVSRVWRTLELRVAGVELDETALRYIREAAAGGRDVRIIPNRPEEANEVEYERESYEARRDHQIPDSEEVLFFEVYIEDASEFSGVVKVTGMEYEGYRVIRARGNSVPNTIAAFLLEVQKITERRPHAYFNWVEGNPAMFLIKYLLSGQGDIGPVTREILRQVEPDPEHRPVIHAA
ncbi:MAG: amino acid transporter [Fimbriimonas sp.]